MNTKVTFGLCALLGFGTLLAGSTALKATQPVNQMRFCASFTTAYHDILPGQDVLTGTTAPANNHYAVVRTTSGTEVWRGYMSGNCTGYMQIDPSPWHEFWVTNQVQIVPNKYVWVYPDSSEQLLWHEQTFNTPANPIGDSTFSVTFQGTLPDHVSLLAAAGMYNSQMVIPPGYTSTIYKAYSSETGLSYTEGGGNYTVHIGQITVNGVVQSDATWRSVVGHEFGHEIAGRMYGGWAYDYNYGPAGTTNPACNCDNVEVPADRQHCLNSREQVGAARQEAWAHANAISWLNSPTDSTAPFGYYKRFYDPQAPGNHVLNAPVGVDGVVAYKWQNAYCPLNGVSTEMDWTGVFYQLENKTSNAWTMGNFWNVFWTECPPPNGTCTVSWQSLANAGNAFFGLNAPKATYLLSMGNTYGVDH